MPSSPNSPNRNTKQEQTKRVGGLYNEHYTTLEREIEGDTERHKDLHVHGLVQFILFKCPSTPLKLIYEFSAIPTQMPMTLFTEQERKKP